MREQRAAKRKQTTMRMRPEIIEQLDAHARQAGISRTQLMENLAVRLLAEGNREPAHDDIFA